MNARLARMLALFWVGILTSITLCFAGHNLWVIGLTIALFAFTRMFLIFEKEATK